MKDNFDVHSWNIKRYLNELDINKQGGEDDIDQEDVAGSLNVTHGGDDPTIGAEEEAGAIGDRVEENESYLNTLASKLSSKYPDLNFNVRDEPYFDRIDVIGSERDKLIFGDKFHGEKFGEYEVFHTDDDDRGEIVRIVKSDSIMRSKNESLKAVEETVKFIMEDLEGYSNYFPDGKTTGLTSDEMSTILMQIVKDIEENGKQLQEKLCKKGEAYRKRRMAAGEKSSAYLSGRAVKVCKGQMSGKKKKK